MKKCNDLDLSLPPNERARLGQLLLYLADDVLDAVNNALKPYHISESKLSLLLLFVITNNNEQHSLQPSEIAEKLGIRRASVTKQLIYLEEQKLISRTVSTEDQRMVDVKITALGDQLLSLVMPHYWQACAEMANCLTEEETMLLIILLRKIHHKSV
jgi:DNA-binding MarR family transcriptional regulator